MDAFDNIAHRIGSFETGLLAHIPHAAAVRSIDPTALGWMTVLAAIGLAMYKLVGSNSV